MYKSECVLLIILLILFSNPTSLKYITLVTVLCFGVILCVYFFISMQKHFNILKKNLCFVYIGVLLLQCIHIYSCVIRTNKMHFFLLIYFNNHPLHVSSLCIIRPYFTVCAAYGIYLADNILKLCKITYIYIVTKSVKYCIICKVSDYIKRFFG